MRILTVDDDEQTTELIQGVLTAAGYPVESRTDAPGALAAVIDGVYDLLIVSVDTPGLEGGGVEVCRRLRRTRPDLPVLLVTALDPLHSRVRGLDAGADDYLVQPFHTGELLDRVRALLRRTPAQYAPVITVRDVTLDTGLRRAYRGGRTIALTGKEFAVLEFLMRSAGTVVSPAQLIHHAWNPDAEQYSNVVQTYIRYLRKKLAQEGEAEFIETRRGIGYLVRTHL